MKRIGHVNGHTLFQEICSYNNLKTAITEGCRDHHRDVSVLKIKQNPEPYINEIQQLLCKKAYHPTGFKKKNIHEHGKTRKLCYVNTFPDRIIQHAVFNVVSPILQSTIPSCAFAGVKGRGLHKGMRKIESDLHHCPHNTRYALKLDVYHFFPSIDRELLFKAVKRHIKDRDVLDLIHTIIFSPPGKGLPIGMYSSQILSVFYLADVDNYLKCNLRVRFYYRYMDDIVVLSSNKQYLWGVLALIRNQLYDLKLKIKGNYAIFPIEKRRLDFMGFVFDHHQTMIRKRIKQAYRKQVRYMIKLVAHGIPLTIHEIASRRSYEGMIGWCSSRDLVNKISGCLDS